MTRMSRTLGGHLDKVVIAVSTGRTGTKAIAHYFDTCYPQVRGLHEPRPSWRLRIASSRYASGGLSKDDLERLLLKCRRRLIESLTEPVYLESNPSLFGFLEVVDEVIAEPRIVHIVRDPRTYIRSVINFGSFRGLKGLAVKFCPHWVPKPEHFAKRPAARWGRMSPPVRLAWLWTTINSILDHGRELFGDRYVRLRFEDLFAAHGPGLRQLAQWVGLPENAELVTQAREHPLNASSRQVLPTWQQWDPQLLEQVDAHCGELMESYGYQR